MRKLLIMMGLSVIALMLLSIESANAQFDPPAFDCLGPIFKGASGEVGYNCKVECADGATETTTSCYTNEVGPVFSQYYSPGLPGVAACTCFGKYGFMCIRPQAGLDYAQYGKLYWFGQFLKLDEIVESNVNGGCHFKCVRCTDCCPSPPT
jgi:hypothetical protein